MKNLNKILAMVIVLAMALSTVAFAGSFTDVTADASYSEAVEVMAALGLLAGYEDGTFGPDKTITRAEFAAVIVRAIGMEDSAKGSYGATNFSDVKADDWFAGYVMIAAQQKIVNGYPDGTFQPNKEVKFEEAVKMIICALGYAPKFADVEDAYPTAYIAQAHTSGITTGANLAIGTDASRAVVARLVYNSLDVGKMEQVTFGTEKEWAVPTYAKTLLSENLNVAKVKGSVNAIEFNNENGRKLTFKVAKDGMAKQYDTAYDLYYPNAALGTTGSNLNLEYAEGVAPLKYYATTAFVDMSDDTNPVVLAIVEQAGKNETLTITGTQAKDSTVYTAATPTADGKIGYFKTSADVDSKETEVKLAKGAEIYVNLNTTSGATSFASNYKAGYYPVVTLIDNDNTVNGYEVIYATEYYSAVVDEIVDRSNRISFSAGTKNMKAAITLNPTSENYTFDIYDEEGNAIAFEDIKVDDVLNVFTSVDANSNTYYEIYVTSTKLEGAVDEVVDKEHYVIGGEEYYSCVALEAGDSGIFYVDMYGKVLKHELGDDSNRSFAVLYAAYEDANGVDKEPKVILYTADGEFVEYGFAKNVNVNGVLDSDPSTPGNQTTKYTSIQKATIKNADTFAAIGGANQKIVMYTVNSSDLISEFYWADGVARRDANYDVKAIAGNVDNNSDSKYDGVSYKANSGKLDSVIVPEDFTFVTIEDKDYQTTLDRTNFGTADASVLVDDDNTTYVVQFVQNVKEDKVAAFGVLFDCKASVASDADVMFVTNVGASENSEGSPATKITGFVNGEKVSVIATAGETVIYNGAKAVAGAVADIAKGAVIQYTGSEEAQAIRILAKDTDIKGISTTTKLFGGADEEDDNIGFAYVGSLTEYSRGIATFATTGLELAVASGTPTMIVRNNGNVYVSDDIVFGVAETDGMLYDSDNDGDLSDEANDDKVFVYFFDGEAVAAVIYDGSNDDIWN